MKKGFWSMFQDDSGAWSATRVNLLFVGVAWTAALITAMVYASIKAHAIVDIPAGVQVVYLGVIMVCLGGKVAQSAFAEKSQPPTEGIEK